MRFDFLEDRRGHPLGDWAECFAHYLHIGNALETAKAHGMVDDRDDLTLAEQPRVWHELTVSLNKTCRGFGVGDAYPFIVTAAFVKIMPWSRRTP